MKINKLIKWSKFISLIGIILIPISTACSSVLQPTKKFLPVSSWNNGLMGTNIPKNVLEEQIPALPAQKFDYSKLENLPMPIIDWLSQNPNDNVANLMIPKFDKQNEKVFDFFAKRLINIDVLKANNSGEISIAYGTGWIIGKASKSTNSLEYYVATNSHVTNAFIFNPQNPTIGYYFTPSPLINYLKKEQFPSTTFLKNEDLDRPTTIGNKFTFSRMNGFDFRQSDFVPFNFKISSLSPVFYQAKNFGAKNVYYAQSTDKFGQINDVTKSWSPRNLNSINNFNYALDFSIFKIDFSDAQKIVEENRISRVEKEQTFKNFFQSLKTLDDISFASPTKENNSIGGYIAGFPAQWTKDETDNKNQFVSIEVGKSDYNKTILGSNVSQLLVGNLNTSRLIPYWTPSVNYSVPALNLGPGSSGSVYLNKNAEVEGIYWGIISDSTNRKNQFNGPKDLGQITRLAVQDKYDVIGLKKQF